MVLNRYPRFYWWNNCKYDNQFQMCLRGIFCGELFQTTWSLAFWGVYFEMATDILNEVRIILTLKVGKLCRDSKTSLAKVPRSPSLTGAQLQCCQWYWSCAMEEFVPRSASEKTSAFKDKECMAQRKRWPKYTLPGGFLGDLELH